MVFSMASIPIMELSCFMCSKISSKVLQQISSSSSLGKNLCAAMSWNDPGTPCIAILFIYISFSFVDFSLLLYSKNPTSFQKRDLLVLIFSTIKRMIMYLRLCIQIPASLYC